MTKQPDPGPDGRPTILTLQAGRGAAAAAVVFHHAQIAAAVAAGPAPGDSIATLGYLGVDFFFVLSGFIISYTTGRPGDTLSAYAIRRARRIYLPYFPIGIAIALAYVLAPSMVGRPPDWSWFATLTLAPIAAEPALSVAWTLQRELLFYAIFGVGFFLGRTTLVLGCWALLILGAQFVGLGGQPALHLVNLEFLFGVALAAAYRRGLRIRFLWLGAPFLIAAWWMLGAERQLSVLVGAAIVCLLHPLVEAERDGRIRLPSWTIALGAASYSIYLVHNPAISVGRRLVEGGGWGIIVMLGALGIAAGLAYYLLVERPLMRLGSRRPAHRPRDSVPESGIGQGR